MDYDKATGVVFLVGAIALSVGFGMIEFEYGLIAFGGLVTFDVQIGRFSRGGNSA